MEVRVKKKSRHWPYVLIVLVLLGIYVAWTQVRPLPKIKAQAVALAAPAANVKPKLGWPATGQAAIGILGSPILETNGQQTNQPTASTAKLLTVLTVLEHKPLSLGKTGPMITLGPGEVALYKTYAAQGGSVTPVTAGEQISEYQMLQTILLPSANNMADSLATWAFGSLQEYKTAADNYLAQHGLKNTVVGSDASGYSPSTTSTAHDLVKLGELAMSNPVISQIVAQPNASGIPVAGTIKNVNWLLGTAGIVGVKTGNTEQAGGVYVAASKITINGQALTIVTARLGATSLAAALKDSLVLIQSAQTNFPSVKLAKANQIAGYYQPPWSHTKIPALVNKDLSLQVWNGSSYTTSGNLKPINPSTTSGTTVGTINVTANGQAKRYKIPIKLRATIPQPSRWWRLTHPF